MKTPSKHQKVIISLWVTIPALIPLIYMFIAYKFRLYEMLFFVEIRDTHAVYQGIQVQYGVKRALRHIHEGYPWYRYSTIVFFFTYFYSNKLFLIKQKNIIGLYFRVLGIYIVSVFISILIFYLTTMLLGRGDINTWIFFIPESAIYTLFSFIGSSDFYAPYALPSVIASIFVSVGIFKYKNNLDIKVE